MTFGVNEGIDSYNDYYPFGEAMPGRSQFNAGPDTRYGYISVENDVETGLYHTGPRTYDPWKLGFDQPEPVTTDTTLMDWSMYQYGFDNPERYKDPTGKDPNFLSLLANAWNSFTNEVISFRNSIVNSMGYEHVSTEQMQAENEQQSSTPGVPTAKQMSKLGFQAVSNFTYAESLGSVTGAGATLMATGSMALGRASIALTIAGTALTLERDHVSGSNYYNALGGGYLGALSYISKVPVGALYSGSRFSEAAYMSLLPPPPPIGQ